MAAVVVVGNHLLLLLESSSSRSSSAERHRIWHTTPQQEMLTMSCAPKRDLPSHTTNNFSDPEARVDAASVPTRLRQLRRGSQNSKLGAVGGSGGGGGVSGGGDDWDEREAVLRRRLKELEEMKELEKQAEELQRSIDGEDREETEGEKRQRVRRKLEKLAKEQVERRETAKLMFELGQKAYGKGMYTRSIEFLEAALTIIPRPTLFGGEIQIWLAMAYEANNRHRDCIALYQQLEKKHPSVSIRRQAAELRYILQAPKLKISKDEMVTIPPIGSSYDWYAPTWSDKYKDRNKRSKTMTTTNQLPLSRDYLGDFLVWRPLGGWEKNQTFWVVTSLWMCLLGAALLLQK